MNLSLPSGKRVKELKYKKFMLFMDGPMDKKKLKEREMIIFTL